MKIGVICNDTRGGVQPYVALAQEIGRAGHDLVAVAPADQAHLFQQHVIATQPLAGDMKAAVQRLSHAVGGGALRTLRDTAKESARYQALWRRAVREACGDRDLVLGGIGGLAISHELPTSVRIVQAHLQPVGAPSSLYPPVLAPWAPSLPGGVGWAVAHHAFDALLNTALGGALNVRAATGRLPRLYGFSPQVAPVQSSPRTERIATGYWRALAPTDWTPPAALEAFLQGPGPVVSIGFGSMPVKDPTWLRQLVEETVARLGVRAVLLSGWSEMRAGRSDRVMVVDEAPHDWLFERVDAIVHHGGAGTTGAALHAGKPSLVVPFTMDQPFWGARVFRLGVGARPIPIGKLTSASLGAALQTMLSDSEMQCRARDFAGLLQAENGARAAANIVERLGHR